MRLASTLSPVLIGAFNQKDYSCVADLDGYNHEGRPPDHWRVALVRLAHISPRQQERRAIAWSGAKSPTTLFSESVVVDDRRVDSRFDLPLG
jgi:hypothetical protein